MQIFLKICCKILKRPNPKKTYQKDSTDSVFAQNSGKKDRKISPPLKDTTLEMAWSSEALQAAAKTNNR